MLLKAKQLLMTYFFFGNYSDIKTNCRCLERGLLTLQVEVLALAFKENHERDEKDLKQK